MLMTKRLAGQIYNIFKESYNHFKTDVFIISFPKSGRTWLRLLIGKALCYNFGIPDENMLDTFSITTGAGILRSRFTHDKSSHGFGYSYYNLPTDKSKYKKKKVVFLCRNIKDLIVSCYFQATKRIGKYECSISDYIRNERYGVKKVATFYNIWHNNMEIPESFLFIRYEDLHRNPEEVLTKVLSFIGLKGIESHVIKKAIDFASFSNMKRMEMNGFFNSPVMRPGENKDKESYKVRRGVVGGYSAYLTKEDVIYIDQRIDEMGCPFEHMQMQETNSS